MYQPTNSTVRHSDFKLVFFQLLWLAFLFLVMRLFFFKLRLLAEMGGSNGKTLLLKTTTTQHTEHKKDESAST